MKAKAPTLLISAVVAGLCAGLLVLFTDIEVSVVRWFNCGPFATQQEDRSELCRRRL
jgi:hypothetical protein